jgi:hypothetical protein
LFFFEKKNQKTFIHLVRRRHAAGAGGSGRDGVIFELTRQSRAVEVIYCFTGGADRSLPILGSRAKL